MRCLENVTLVSLLHLERFNKTKFATSAQLKLSKVTCILFVFLREDLQLKLQKKIFIKIKNIIKWKRNENILQSKV